MGECGCGDWEADVIYRVKKPCIIGLRVYRGCRDCDTGVGVALDFFTPKSEYIRDCDVSYDAIPDEYGADLPGLPLFEVGDLIEASRTIDSKVGNGGNDYATIQDWLYDNGLTLIQEAMAIRDKKTKKANPVGKVNAPNGGKEGGE